MAKCHISIKPSDFINSLCPNKEPEFNYDFEAAKRRERSSMSQKACYEIDLVQTSVDAMDRLVERLEDSTLRVKDDSLIIIFHEMRMAVEYAAAHLHQAQNDCEQTIYMQE